MAIVETHSPPSLNDLLKGAAQLDEGDLERFVSQVLALRAKRVAPNIPMRETELLETINQGLPPETQQRFDNLVTKRQIDALTAAEHDELLALIDRTEQADVERVHALTMLAELRNTPVKTLMDELDIHPPAYG